MERKIKYTIMQKILKLFLGGVNFWRYVAGCAISLPRRPTYTVTLVRTQSISIGGGEAPKHIYNLCLILKFLFL